MSIFSQWKARELKWNLDVPWMTEAEAGAFKMFRRTAEVSAFRVRYCEGMPLDKHGNPKKCTNEVPKVDKDDGTPAKPYCSRRCHDSVNESDEDEPDESA